ncbi:MAG TPA: bile acid:sodium symporter family protein [Thiothrix sp.]|nr:bile acid:sodium symporter family protein [Thiothrix sp.]
MTQLIQRIIYLFPLWALILSTIAYIYPAPLIELKTWIIPLLSLIMFGMGLSLTLADFQRVFQRPRLIMLGVALQFILMPFYAWLIAHWLGLSPLLLAGMVLVGTSPGGTASNVIAYLAKADVALSITLTSLSTLLAVVLTPYLTLFYVGESVPLQASAMLFSILKIVFLPVALGLLINTFFATRISAVKAFFPLLSVLAIVLIIAIIVALNHGRLADVGMVVLSAVILHNVSGLITGYGITRLLGYDQQSARTLSIEVGMQNSGLAVALANQYLGAVAALPAALFSIWHNLSGSLVAAWWQRQSTSKKT